MKLIYKILMVIVLLSLLVCSFAVFATAADAFTEEDIEKILEYHCTSVYVHDYMDNTDIAGITPALKYSLAEIVKDPLDDGNNLLHVVPSDMRNANLVCGFGENTHKSLVLTTRVMFGAPVDDGNADTEECAPTFDIFIRMGKPNGLHDTATFFTIDYKSGEIAYNSYDSASGRLNKVNKVNFAPKYDVWYELAFVFNFVKGSYDITINGSDGSTFTANANLGEFSDAREVRMLLSESRLANMWIDSMDVYEGSYVRDIDDINNVTATAIINLDELSKSNLSLEARVRIADVYQTLLVEKEFVPNDATPELDKVLAIIEKDMAYKNATYIEAFDAYSKAINTNKSYYDRIDYVDFVDRFNSLLPDTQAELEALLGVKKDTDFAIVKSAMERLNAEISALAVAKEQSESFIDAALAYDATSKDYAYMKSTYAALTSFDKRDATYLGVADANLIYKNLGLKITAIEDIVNTFMDNVKAMATIIDSLPASDAQCGDAFEVLYYTNYKTALSLYADGNLYDGLDNSTYTRGGGANTETLSDSIATFLLKEKYIDARIAVSKEFISLVETAASTTTYATMQERLDLAEPYIDNDVVNKSVEPKYEGVEEAISLYNSLREKLKSDAACAELYVLEVAKIANAKTYAQKKAAVESALKLKATGNVAGLPGVKEANIALANAQTEIECLEGYSKTLIDSVAALTAENNTLTLAERRELIEVASSAKGQSTEEISGVKEAKSALDAAIKSYNDAVASANAQLADAVTNSGVVASSGNVNTASDFLCEIIKAIFGK